MSAPALAHWQVQDWLIDRVAGVLRLRPDDVPADTVFSELGLSSVQAVELAADLEDFSGCALPETFVYDCPTIGAAADYVVTVALPSLTESA